MSVQDNVVSNLLDIRLFTLPGGSQITLVTLILFGLLIAITLLASFLLQRALTKAFHMRRIQDEGTVAVARRLLHYLIMAIGFGIGLQSIGVNLSALFAAGAIFAIGLGFAMQNIMQNFVSGLILLLERAIKPGDVLQVEDRFVKVERMGIRATIARTIDDEEMIVPNTYIVQSIVTNYTLRDSLYRLRAKVGVAYGSDLAQVREALERTARGVDWRQRVREPVVLLTGFGESSVNFEVSVWIDDPWHMRRLLSKLNEALWWALKDAGISMAYKQVDVHFDPPVVQALQEMRKAG